MKKILSVLIATVILLSVFVCTAGAEVSASVKAGGQTYSVEKGDTLTYTCELQNDEVILCGELQILYTSDALKAVEAQSYNVKNCIKNIDIPGEVNVNFSTPKGHNFIEKKTFLVIKFEVVGNVDGEIKYAPINFYNLKQSDITSDIKYFESVEIVKAPTQPASEATPDEATPDEKPTEATPDEPSTEVTTATPDEPTTAPASETETATSTETEAATAQPTEQSETTEPATDASETSEAVTTAPVDTTSPETTSSTEVPYVTNPVTTEPVETIKAPTPKEIIDKAVKSGTKDLKGSSFTSLKARVSKITKNSVTLKWNKKAKSYLIYGGKSAKKAKYLGTTSKTTFKIKKLKKNTAYKFFVAACNPSGIAYITKNAPYKLFEEACSQAGIKYVSKNVFISTKGKKFNYVKKITLAKKTVKLKAKKTYKIKAKEVLKYKNRKLKRYRKLSFESSNKKIASVTSKGKIKAKKKGTAYIYVYAQNGAFAKVKVRVK
ncbi:MAG: Ig-like domain-containing protein [Ruminococcus sp.]|nr:Ig-like domain-containing protein [Ruminococcus sp.]